MTNSINKHSIPNNKLSVADKIKENRTLHKNLYIIMLSSAQFPQANSVLHFYSCY